MPSDSELLRIALREIVTYMTLRPHPQFDKLFKILEKHLTPRDLNDAAMRDAEGK